MLVCVVALVTLTTSDLSGDAKTIASFLFSAIVIKLSMCVASPEPAMIRFASTLSASLYFSYAVFFSAVVTADPFAPLISDLSNGAVTSVKVTLAAFEPQFEPELL